MTINIIIQQGVPEEVLQWARRLGESADMTRKATKELTESEKVFHSPPP